MLWEPADARPVTQRALTGALHLRTAPDAEPAASARHSVGAAATPPGSERRPPSVMRKPPHAAPSTAASRLPTTRVKVVTPALQFATDLGSKLSGCLEVSNLTVVGVLGLDGVGKSTVMSAIASKAENQDSVFPAQSLEAVALGRAETVGIDMVIVPNSSQHRHLVLLDTQPLLSGALLADLLAKTDSTASASSAALQNQQQRGFFNPPAALSAEQQIDVASYQLAVFLASVCHYVIVVHDALAGDGSEDALLLTQFFRGVQQKLEQCRVPHVSGAPLATRKHIAQLMFVPNNMPAVSTPIRERLQRHTAGLELMWGAQNLLRVRQSPLAPIVATSCVEEMKEAPTKWKKRGKPAVGGTSSNNSPSVAMPGHNENPSRKIESEEADVAGKCVPFFLLPHNSELLAADTSEVKRGKPQQRRCDKLKLDASAQALYRFVRALPADSTFTFGSVPELSRPLTLREWLSNASRVFESVRKSAVFTAEYAAGR